jgi:hypothetical protein
MLGLYFTLHMGPNPGLTGVKSPLHFLEDLFCRFHFSNSFCRENFSNSRYSKLPTLVTNTSDRTSRYVSRKGEPGDTCRYLCLNGSPENNEFSVRLFQSLRAVCRMKGHCTGQCSMFFELQFWQGKQSRRWHGP